MCCSIGRLRHGTDQRRPSLTWCQLLMRRWVPRWGRDGSIFSFKHLWHTYDERPLWQLKQSTSDHMFITKPAGIQSRLPQRPFPRSMSSEVQVYEEQRVGVGIQCLARNCGILFLVSLELPVLFTLWYTHVNFVPFNRALWFGRHINHTRYSLAILASPPWRVWIWTSCSY